MLAYVAINWFYLRVRLKLAYEHIQSKHFPGAEPRSHAKRERLKGKEEGRGGIDGREGGKREGGKDGGKEGGK